MREHIRSVLDLEQTLADIAELPYTSRQVKKTDERLKAKRDEVEKYQRYRMKLHEDMRTVSLPVQTISPSAADTTGKQRRREKQSCRWNRR